MIDEGIVSTYYPDCDGDSFGTMVATAVTRPGCVPPTTRSDGVSDARLVHARDGLRRRACGRSPGPPGGVRWPRFHRDHDLAPAPFRWLPTLPGAASARVQVCTDRACTTVVTTVDADDLLSSRRADAAPAVDLPPGVVYWRLFGRSNAAVATTPSVTWEGTIGHRTAGVDTSWGSLLDVNGDGHADIAVGDTGNAAIYVHHGSAAGFGATPTISSVPDALGGFFESAGDISGDGYADLLAGGSGGGFVYAGGPGGASTTAWSSVVLGTFPSASSVAAAGDVDGDVYADVVVGTPNPSGAQIYRGGPAGLASSPSATTSGTAGGVATWPWARGLSGSRPRAAGDVNGDSRADIVTADLVGNPATQIARLLLGAPTNSPPSASGTQPGGGLPTGVGGYQRGWLWRCVDSSASVSHVVRPRHRAAEFDVVLPVARTRDRRRQRRESRWL